MSCVNGRPREDYSFKSFHIKQVVGFVKDIQVMLEEIFSNADSSFFQSEVDWTLPPIYDECTEDGHLNWS